MDIKYLRDVEFGVRNRPSQLKARAKVRPKSLISGHKLPMSKDDWRTVKGEPPHCRCCDTKKDVKKRVKVFGLYLCDTCLRGLLDGKISVDRVQLPELNIQPVDTGKTTNREFAGKGSLPRFVQIARWLQCSCGRRFKWPPFKSYDYSAFNKWIRACGQKPGHRLVDWSDRDPNGQSALISRLWDEILDHFKK